MRCVEHAPENTLHELLTELGYSTRPRGHNYRRELIRDGHVVWTGTAHECWSWLRATGQIYAKKRRKR